MAKELKSRISLSEFAAAMSQLDLSNVPREKRMAAVMDHLMRIEGDTIADRYQASLVRVARRLHHKKTQESHSRVIKVVEGSPIILPESMARKR